MSKLSLYQPELFDSDEETYLQELRADDEKQAADREYDEWAEKARIAARWDDRDWDEVE